MKLTWVLPDWRPVMWFRGTLCKPCFKSCGKNFMISSDVKIPCPDQMTIGEDVYIAHGCWLNAQGQIELEDQVMLGPYTVIASGNHSMENGSYRYGMQLRAKVTVGFGSWTGAGVKVMPGVNIGKSVCCAAGAVVIKDVPDYALAAGVPAKVIKICEHL
ncbi:acyltransferase [Planctomycetota bacterium]|nr:acyltransferase [Planctomycetota bacterium]